MTYQLLRWSTRGKLGDCRLPIILRRQALRVIGIILVLYVMITTLSVISTRRALDSISQLELGATFTSGERGLDDLEERLAVFDRRFGLLKIWLFPVRQSAKIVYVIPPLNRQRSAAELLFERIEIDTDAARTALELAKTSFELRDNAFAESVSISEPDTLAGLTKSLRKLKNESSIVLDLVGQANDVGDRFDELEPVSLLRSLAQKMTVQENRLSEIAEFSYLFSEVMLDDIALMERLTGTFDELANFSNGDTSVDEISVLVSELADLSEAASRKSENMVAAAPRELRGTEYGNMVQAIDDLNRAVYGLLGSTSAILDAVADAFNSLATSDSSLFDDGAGITSTLEGLIDNEEMLVASVAELRESVETLLVLGESGPISLGSLNGVLKDRVKPLLDISEFAVSAPRIAGELFGIDGDRKQFLALAHTSDELRAVGGFTSSAWLLTFKSGALVDREYLEITTIEDSDSLDRYPEAHEALQTHMDAGRIYMRDVGWDPNFPTVARLATELYAINNTAIVDGVISLNQWSFIEFTSALGGLNTPSGIVEADQLLSVIETGTDDEGTVFLTSIFESLLNSIDGDTLKTNGVDVLRTTSALFASKDLMIYSANPEIQSLIQEIGWGGVFPNSKGDRLGIVDSNIGWNKVDRNIDRKFNYRVDLSELDDPNAELELEYTNRSIADDKKCDIQSQIKGRSYSDLLNDCYWNYIRVYFQNGSELEINDELPLDPGSIAAKVGGQLAGSRTIHQMFDDNGQYISGVMAVDPESSRSVTFRYSLPRQVLQENDGVFEYTLNVIAQGGTRGRQGRVTVKLPDGFEILDDGQYGRVESNVIEYLIDSDRDQVINLKFTKSS